MRENLENPSDLEHCGCCGSDNIDTGDGAAGQIASCRVCFAEASWWSPPTGESDWTTQERAHLGRERLAAMIDDADRYQWEKWSDEY